MQERYVHWIGGAAREPSSAAFMDSQNPRTLEAVTRIALGNADDVDDAVRAAEAAREDWRRRKPIERGRILMEIARLMRERMDALARIECAETGKPDFQAPWEMGLAADYFEFYAGLVNLPAGEVLDLGPDYHSYTLREPYGVVGVITPWNAPINQAARAAAPALAAGNVVVCKPSEFTSATTVELAAIATEAGLPAGVFNVVLGTGADVGAAIVSHPAVRKVAFTGSIRAGREVGQIAAARVIPVTLELGGKSPHILFEDANLQEAIPTALRTMIANAGQICSAGTRLYVHESIMDPVCAALQQAAGAVETGVHLGPVTTEAQYEKVQEYFAIAEEEGLEKVVDGGVFDHPDGGWFIAPTVYRAHPDSRLVREEIFGPVLVVLPFKDEADVIAQANDTEYGLASGLWTQDLSRAHRVASRLEAGQVFVNDWVSAIETPFGGYKSSGIGREKGIEALHHYTQVKSITVKL